MRESDVDASERSRVPLAVYQKPRTIDDSDRPDAVGRTLTRRYTHVATIEGVPIWRLKR